MEGNTVASTIYLVIPCYNEEEVLPETSKRLKIKINGLIEAGTISPDSRILFVDDGSKDRTWDMISYLHSIDSIFSGLKLSRNRGHQNALLAGLMTVKDLCDAAISLDADLQDDVEVIDRFIENFHDGCDVVYGVRRERKTDSFFKRTTAVGFYRFMQAMGVDIVFNHADYRLMSKRALEALSGYREVNLFLRGMVPLIGFKSSVVEYDRAERFAGESKYPLKKMLSFAADGITSFSVKPLRLITVFGSVVTFLAVLALIYALVAAIIGTDIGMFALAASIWLLAGVQLICLGIIGSYIGRIYSEVKQRPRFIIEKLLNKR